MQMQQTVLNLQTEAPREILQIVSQEVDKIFQSVDAQHKKATNVPLNRLTRAGLTPHDAQRAADVLLKLGSIDASRQAISAENRQLKADIHMARSSHRSAEFARARAEALAVARGESLEAAQEAAHQAETQQIELSEMLRSALQQLGIEAPDVFSPSPNLPRTRMRHNEYEQQSSPALSGFTVHTNELSDSPPQNKENINCTQVDGSVAWRDISEALAQAAPERKHEWPDESLVNIGASLLSNSNDTSLCARLPTGTFLSPTAFSSQLSAMPPRPSPQSHIHAVRKHTDNLQFYLPFSAGLPPVSRSPKKLQNHVLYKQSTRQNFTVHDENTYRQSSPSKGNRTSAPALARREIQNNWDSVQIY